jgi:hypothetical protein
MEKETILVLDFGGQYNQLIARRVRELSVYTEMVPFDISYEKIQAHQHPDSQTGARKGLPPQYLIRYAKFLSDHTHFILEKHPQRLY